LAYEAGYIKRGFARARLQEGWRNGADGLGKAWQGEGGKKRAAIVVLCIGDIRDQAGLSARQRRRKKKVKGKDRRGSRKPTKEGK